MKTQQTVGQTTQIELSAKDDRHIHCAKAYAQAFIDSDRQDIVDDPFYYKRELERAISHIQKIIDNS